MATEDQQASSEANARRSRLLAIRDELDSVFAAATARPLRSGTPSIVNDNSNNRSRSRSRSTSTSARSSVTAPITVASLAPFSSSPAAKTGPSQSSDGGAKRITTAEFQRQWEGVLASSVQIQTAGGSGESTGTRTARTSFNLQPQFEGQQQHVHHQRVARSLSPRPLTSRSAGASNTTNSGRARGVTKQSSPGLSTSSPYSSPAASALGRDGPLAVNSTLNAARRDETIAAKAAATVAKSNELVESLKLKVSRLSVRCSALERQLSLSQGEVNALRTRMEEAKNGAAYNLREANECKRTTEAAHSMVAEKEKTLALVMAERDSLQDQLRRTTAENEMLRARFDEEALSRDELLANYSALTEANKQLSEKVCTLMALLPVNNPDQHHHMLAAMTARSTHSRSSSASGASSTASGSSTGRLPLQLRKGLVASTTSVGTVVAAGAGLSLRRMEAGNLLLQPPETDPVQRSAALSDSVERLVLRETRARSPTTQRQPLSQLQAQQAQQAAQAEISGGPVPSPYFGHSLPQPPPSFSSTTSRSRSRSQSQSRSRSGTANSSTVVVGRGREMTQSGLLAGQHILPLPAPLPTEMQDEGEDESRYHHHFTSGAAAMPMPMPMPMAPPVFPPSVARAAGQAVKGELYATPQWVPAAAAADASSEEEEGDGNGGSDERDANSRAAMLPPSYSTYFTAAPPPPPPPVADHSDQRRRGRSSRSRSNNKERREHKEPHSKAAAGLLSLADATAFVASSAASLMSAEAPPSSSSFAQQAVEVVRDARRRRHSRSNGGGGQRFSADNSFSSSASSASSASSSSSSSSSSASSSRSSLPRRLAQAPLPLQLQQPSYRQFARTAEAAHIASDDDSSDDDDDDDDTAAGHSDSSISITRGRVGGGRQHYHQGQGQGHVQEQEHEHAQQRLDAYVQRLAGQPPSSQPPAGRFETGSAVSSITGGSAGIGSTVAPFLGLQAAARKAQRQAQDKADMPRPPPFDPPSSPWLLDG